MDPLQELLMWAEQIVDCRAYQRISSCPMYTMVGELDAIIAIHDLRQVILNIGI